MDQIDLRAATVGLVAGVLGCHGGSRAGRAQRSASGAGPRGGAAGLLVLVGALVAPLQRRRLGLWTRTAALRTTLTAGGAGLVVALVLEAAAVAAQGGPGVMPATVLLEAVVWLGGHRARLRPGAYPADARVRAVGALS